ncbi:PfkB family carbohydrate kinase [Clostridium oryzae]|uniref:Fructosamine kinase FrlD n=1 Tax=Clostridium oryzae TaxID=1450648 RepID=A0A1V4IDQ9_9CLOT|nr:PfkB family carbohydrate kinase [Clostridium oryzae]OPJ58020.1 fructosamine kinase FrlD [Clostridium oryzae]
MEYDVSVVGFGDNVVDIYVHKNTQYPGGNCVNFAVYAKMFGVRRSAYMGYFGINKDADHVISILDNLNIEMVKCKQIEGENGYSRCTLKDGERVFLDYNEGGVRSKHIYNLDRFDLEYLKEFDLIHCGNYCYMESQLPKIHNAGLKLSFDFSDDSTEQYYSEIAPLVNYAFCSFDGSDEEVKQHLTKIASYGPEIACASRGKKGCIIYDGNKFYEQSAKPIEKVVDTMGAGDSLITTFMVGYIDRIKKGIDKEKAIKESIEKAAEFAATVCQMEGAFGYGCRVLIPRD